MPIALASGFPQTVAGVAGALALIVATPLVVSADTHSTLGAPGVEVPNVVGLQEADATAALAELGFTFESSHEFDDELAAGLVYSSSPLAGTWIDAGGAVHLEVSAGPRMVLVADFSALASAEAPNAIDPRGGPVIVVTQEYSDDVAADVFMSQDLAPGDSVRHDTVVTVVYSLGPEPVVIPKVKGKKKATAIELLEAAGLTVRVKSSYHDSVDAGKVIKQSPMSGEDGHRNDEVTIWVSKGFDQAGWRKRAVEIYAGFFGLTKSQAIAYAKKHGVTIEFTKWLWIPGHDVKVGKVGLVGCSSSPPMHCYLSIPN